MTIAKQGLLVCEMIDRGWVQAIVTTGALMTHGLSEGVGMLHFKHRPSMPDTELYEKGYNRVYDTIELEQNLDDVEGSRAALDALADGSVLSSRLITERLGRYLERHIQGRAILKSAYQKHVPVFVPAFTDSELGLDVAIYNVKRAVKKGSALPFNPFVDLDDFTDRIRPRETLGIFTIGGGVPLQLEAQQVGPYLAIRRKPEDRRAAAPLQVRGAHLPGARALGRALGLQLQRRRLLGQVRARERGRSLRRGLRRRHHRLAAGGTRRDRASLVSRHPQRAQRAASEARSEAKPSEVHAGRATMRAARARGREQIEVARLPIPEPAPGEVLVRVRACGICGSDLHFCHGGLWPPARRPATRWRERSTPSATASTSRQATASRSSHSHTCGATGLPAASPCVAASSRSMASTAAVAWPSS
jgi:hypothetical protein